MFIAILIACLTSNAVLIGPSAVVMGVTAAVSDGETADK